MDYSFIHESSFLLGHGTNLARFGTKYRRKSCCESDKSPKELLARLLSFKTFRFLLDLSALEKVREQASKCYFYVKQIILCLFY